MPDNSPSSKPTHDFIEGKLDDADNKIIKIYTRTPEYVTYLTKNGLRIYTADDHLPKKERIFEKFYEISEEWNEVTPLLNGLFVDDAMYKSVNKGVTLALGGKIGEAKKVLSITKDKLVTIRKLTARLWYELAAYGAFLGIFFILSLFLFQQKAADLNSNIFSVVCCSTAAALGSILSINTRKSDLEFDEITPIPIHILAGVSRVLFAICAAIIVFLGIKSGMFFSKLAEENGEIGWNAYLICTVVGFSERMVPSLLGKVEAK